MWNILSNPGGFYSLNALLWDGILNVLIAAKSKPNLAKYTFNMDAKLD